MPEFTFYKRQGKVVQAIGEAIYVVKRPQIEFTTNYVRQYIVVQDTIQRFLLLTSQYIAVQGTVQSGSRYNTQSFTT